MKTEFVVKESILSLPIPARYSWTLPSNGKPPRQVIILLHGYMERAERIARLLGPAMPEDAAVLVPNGPFPLPISTEQGFKEAYGWYFFDVKTQTMLISPEPAVKMIKDLVHEIGVSDLPVRLVGFSQGGFFAPYLAARFQQVRHVISVGSSRVDLQACKLEYSIVSPK